MLHLLLIPYCSFSYYNTSFSPSLLLSFSPLLLPTVPHTLHPIIISPFIPSFLFLFLVLSIAFLFVLSSFSHLLLLLFFFFLFLLLVFLLLLLHRLSFLSIPTPLFASLSFHHTTP